MVEVDAHDHVLVVDALELVEYTCGKDQHGDELAEEAGVCLGIVRCTQGKAVGVQGVKQVVVEDMWS